MKILVRFFALVALLGIVSSCDIIEQPYTENPTTGGGGDSTKVKKIVLLEDYTGHTCGNCPGAAIIAQQLEDAYSGQVVVLSIHVGFFAEPNTTYPTDFRTAIGTQWDNDFGLSAAGLPRGMVNRIGGQGIGKDQWATEVAKELQSAPTRFITINNSYDTTSRVVNINVETEYLTAGNKNDRLAVVVIETDIIDDQKDYSVTPNHIEHYHHHNALRGGPTGAYGEFLSQTTDPALGDKIAKNYNFALDASWNADNCSVVAFVFDNTTKEVHQAAIQKIK